MNKNLLYSLSGTFLLSVLFSCCNSGIEKGSSTDKPLKYSANSLMKKFEKNPEKYDTVFAQKAIQVRGVIKEIEAASLGNAIFVLKTKSKDGAAIKCVMLNDDMQFQPGDKVKIKGFYKEYQFDVVLDKCLTAGK